MGINAKEIDVTNFKIVDKNETIEVSEPIFKNNKVTSNITFKELNDYVTFEFDLNNNDSIPMRFFKGKLANMEVVLTSDLYS